jgi:hypothetical protein
MLGGEEGGETMDRWARCWSVVVRRDILKQQRIMTTHQRENHADLKRIALAAQKEARRRAQNVQRIAASSRVQVRCKRLVRDLGPAHRAAEAQLLADRKAVARAEWHRRVAEQGGLAADGDANSATE